jgi:hypothetical protein
MPPSTGDYTTSPYFIYADDKKDQNGPIVGKMMY